MEIKELTKRTFVLTDSDSVLCPSNQSSNANSSSYPHRVLISDLVKCYGKKNSFMCPIHTWILIWDSSWNELD